MGLIYFAIPLSGFFMLIYLIRDVYENLKTITSNQSQIMVKGE